ncbi:MAG: hypothetical protein P0121_07465 [Nitrospira sp.]|nr:hypothetical protein [Nitrospira sp.]
MGIIVGAELVFRAAHQIAGGELCGDTLGDAGVQLIVLSPPFRQRVAQIGSCTILRNGQVHPAQPHTMQGPGARTVPIGAGGLGPCVLLPAQLPGQLGLQVPLDPLRNRFQSSLRQSASGGCFLVSRRVCPALSGGLLLVQGDLSARSYREGAGPCSYRNTLGISIPFSSQFPHIMRHYPVDLVPSVAPYRRGAQGSRRSPGVPAQPPQAGRQH